MARIREAKVISNFEIMEGESGTEIRTKSLRVGWASLMMLLAVPTMVIAFVSFAFFISTFSFVAFVLLMIFGGITALLARASDRRKTEKLIISPNGLIANDQLYRYEHINEIGTGNPVDNKIWREGTASGAVSNLKARQANYLYITYGTQKVQLLSGLSQAELDQIYRKLIEILAQRNYWHLA
jgi:hypothetical protein